MGFGSAISTAIASDSLRNTVMADGSYSAVTVGNLSMGNLLTGTIDTGDLSGFNITSARGNLTTGNIYPVSSNDQLGYFNAVTFTGNGLGGTTTQGNAFTQVSRIGFYALAAIFHMVWVVILHSSQQKVQMALIKMQYHKRWVLRTIKV